jgi:peptidoglycan hydrolase-like protein with peptidoglycan-binding domain
LKSKRTKKLTAPAVILLLAGSLSAQTSAATSQKPASHHAVKTHKVSHHSSKKSRKPRGQMAIDGERASQIQAALVREHYMNAEPSGKWDDSTQAAMRRYQADQGWQSKSIPDSRALIRLGLGRPRASVHSRECDTFVASSYAPPPTPNHAGAPGSRAAIQSGSRTRHDGAEYFFRPVVVSGRAALQRRVQA